MRMPAFYNLWNLFLTISFNRLLLPVSDLLLLWVFHCFIHFCSSSFISSSWMIFPFHQCFCRWKILDFILFKQARWGGSVTVNVYDLTAVISVKLVKISTKQMESKCSNSLGFVLGFFSYFFMLVIQSFNLILLGCTLYKHIYLLISC